MFQCSHTCGKGVKHRGVSCRRINIYGWPDPDPVSHGCNATEKPREVETCVINGDCKHKSVLWKVGLWEPVSTFRKYNHNQYGAGKKIYELILNQFKTFLSFYYV